MNTMTNIEELSTIALSARGLLTENILPFWIEKMTDPRGGYYGEYSIMDNAGPQPESPKGAILNARILWAFSAAYRVLGEEKYLQAATRAKREIIDHFYDRDFGGVYWSLNSDGTPLDTKKQTYALGFAIYGLSEYARATADTEALDYALRLFRDLESHAYDPLKGGYLEAFTRQWGHIDDMRLSDKDENMAKTMNTHLHVIEPYTNLYRISRSPKVKDAIIRLLGTFRSHIADISGEHLQLFFDENWNPTSSNVSFGHDIEASWLLHESALVLGDENELRKTVPLVKSLAEGALGGWSPTDQWWVFAETMVGFANICEHFPQSALAEKALEILRKTWDFIQNHLVDREGGEWWWSVLPDGQPNRSDPKAGFWKCPYHNSRMCLELIERFA